ncbi:YciI family protein [Kitasatospora putterlickiae]|uniref:YciI family protein n=1 Tax=Kitasatospora putterlickiae TaxID=221725 RepID=A0ABN1XJ63_9ACTN
MKYMLLMQFSAKDLDIPKVEEWPIEDVRIHVRYMRDLNAELNASGELVDAQGLAMPETARIVRAGGGAPVVTDGPFPETKEWLAGWWIVDCAPGSDDDGDGGERRAIEIAAKVSAAPGPGGRPLDMPVEVRRIMSEPPVEV